MEGVLKYDLPEEREEMLHAIHGIDWYCVVWDFDQWLRNEHKHNEREEIFIEEARQKINDLTALYGINLND